MTQQQQTALFCGGERVWLAALVMAWIGVSVSACAPSVAEPTRGLAVSIRGPLTNSPFDDPAVAFVRLTVEGPDLKDNTYQTTTPYKPGLAITGPAAPYGAARQVRVELFGRGVNGEAVPPALGMGRTPRQTVKQGESFLLDAFVTKTNAFTPAAPNDNSTVQTHAATGAGVVATGLGDVVIAGGASPVQGAIDPFAPKSWTAFSDVVAIYNEAKRIVSLNTATAGSAKLSTGRAFMATATAASGLVVFSGGYVDKGAGPVPSALMEYRDPETGEIKAGPPMQVARAHHSIIQMYPRESVFLIAGGIGADGKTLDSWEVWHLTEVLKTNGRLARPRSHHATSLIKSSELDGYLVLIGGEDDAGTIGDMELIRFYNTLIASRGETKVTCCFAGKCYLEDAESTEKCGAAFKNDPKSVVNYYEWIPFPIALPSGGVTMPAAVRVEGPGQNLIYIAGGFADKEKTQPVAHVNVFNLSPFQPVPGAPAKPPAWVAKTTPLLTPRGAPVMGWSTVGEQRGRVIVTGGIGADGKTVATGEVLSYSVSGDEISRAWSSNPMSDGGRIFAGAVSLSTGQVLFAGGAGKSGAEWVTTRSVQLYNPR